MRHHRRRENSFASLRSIISNCCAQLFQNSSNLHGEKLFDWVISSDLLPLNNPDMATLPRRFSSSRYSSDIFFAPSSLALSCSWEVIQDLGADHLPILLTVLFLCYSTPTNVPFPSILRKLSEMIFYFDSHCPSAEKYSSLSLSSAASLFTSLTLNAPKSSISFGRIKRPPKAW